MVSRRRMARIITKSVMGQRLNLWDGLQLWRWRRRWEYRLAAYRDARRVDRVGAAVVWAGRAFLAFLAFIGIIWLTTPWIGGFAPLVAMMAMLVLGAHWIKK